MAHGQAMTNTAIALKTPWGNAAFPPRIHQARNVINDIPATTGTKTIAALSMTRCTGALELWACCTMRMMWARAVSSPICLAFMRSLPWLGMVPANTRLPFRLATGDGSPEIMLSST